MMGTRIAIVLALLTATGWEAAASTEQWVEVNSSHFMVMTDASEKEGRRLVDQFERMRWVFHTLFPEVNVDPAQPIIVVAAKNEKVFATIEPAAYLGKGQMKIGGLFMNAPDKNYILLRLDAEFEHPYATVYHEYTHLQFAPGAEWMPLWLDEGLAEFMQNTEIHDKEVRLGEPSGDDILFLRQNRIVPLSVLFKVDASSPYYHEEQKGSVFYAESWALTHYLMVTDRENHTHRLPDYMKLMSQKEDPVAGAQRAFGDLKQLEMDLESYIRDGRYMQFVLSSAAAPIDESKYTVRALTPVEADAARADVLAYVGRKDEARALLDTVLKEDANNLQAHETMGFLEIQAGNREASGKWYEEAVKLNSQDYLANYYFAAISMGTGTATDAEIENSLRAAIRLNPRFAPSYDRLAAFYAMRRENLDAAHLLSLQAVQLDPGNLIYRLNAANVLMAMRRDADAVLVLKAAAKVAKNPAEAAMVQTQLQHVQDYQAERAQEEAYSKAQAKAQVSEKVTVIDVKPVRPTENADGPKRTAVGVIKDVVCKYPMKIEFHVEMATGKPIALYNNDFSKIDLTAVGFAPPDSMNPCTDFTGMKARVQYVGSTDKTVDGQVTAVELRK